MSKYKAKKAEENKQEIIKQKRRKIREKRVYSDTEAEVRRFIIIFVIILVIVIGIYLISKIVVDKRNLDTTNPDVEGAIDYTMVNVGTILNRPYNDYYVMIYDSEDSSAIHYSAIITKYQKKEEAKKLYYCDLGSALNVAYKTNGDTGNINAKTTDDFAFGKVTLLQIKNGKVSKYIEGLDNIKSTLQ